MGAPPMMPPPGAMPPHMAGGRAFGPRGTALHILSTAIPGSAALAVMTPAAPCMVLTGLGKVQGSLHLAPA